MKIILAIIAASCIVDCTSSQLSSALSCYQSCQDAAFRFTDPAVAEKFEQNPVEGPPNCGASDMFACNEDNFYCAAVELSMEGTMFGESVAAETFMRECVAPGTSEETYCSEVKSAMTSTSDDVIDFKSCELYLCYTDNCNTFGMERFQDDGEGNDGEKDEKDDGETNDGESDEKDDGEREKYVSSDTKLTISFLLIQLVSFLTVAFL